MAFLCLVCLWISFGDNYCDNNSTQMKRQKIALFWFRRDLRLEDNAGLYYALKKHNNVVPIFIFDTQILDALSDKKDRRVDFIHQVVGELQRQLLALGSTLLVFKGKPLDVFRQLTEAYEIEAVYANRDYEPYATSRDQAIEDLLLTETIPFYSHKDQVVFEMDEVLKDNGTPYTVFTPYSRKWKAKLKQFYYKPYPNTKYFHHFLKTDAAKIFDLSELGFLPTGFVFQPPTIEEAIVAHYAAQRDFPALNATSRLSVHLRFGTISIRSLVAKAIHLSETWLNELIWREFYMSILYHYPHVVQSSFKPQYDRIEWRNNNTEFAAWCNGQTGYPIVDAGMRELNATGFMHNRLRMITASFLTKHLLIDWRWGEAYFAQKLLDFDCAANNGGWQWAAGTGCDAAPYFRIFNPYEQTKKFDKDLKYIRKWVPEFEGFDYPAPIVEHKFARERVLGVYKAALQE